MPYMRLLWRIRLSLVLRRVLPTARVPRRRLVIHDALPCTAPVPRSPASGDAPQAQKVCIEREPDTVSLPPRCAASASQRRRGQH